ncbi:MAG: succinyldiaminopimelate transaminase [Thiomonas sp.]
MNPRLDLLQPYPFEKLRALTQDVTPPAQLPAISLGIGEPRHPTPQFIRDALTRHLDGLAVYPSTTGTLALRQACAQWAQRRYGIALDAQTQVLPVNGSREALFAIAQTVVDSSRPAATVVCPNPFYQIYEGAALLAGAQPYFAAVDPQRNFAVDWAAVPEAVWQRTQLLYVCSPGNPTGAVMPLAEWKLLFELSDRHGFVIASDECYSEIWFGAQPPLGGLQAAWQLGRRDFRRLLMFTSLSKRSNVPGLRSGFVAGDASLIGAFTRYRTYHGSAMNPAVQAASTEAWGDEAHVAHNRALYREKFAAVLPILQPVMDVRLPDAGFYLWAGTPIDDTEFARGLLEKYNVTVLPGSYLARTQHGHNPGSRRVRLALVAQVEECVEAARRIAAFCSELNPSH